MDIRGIGGERDKENLLGEEGDTEVHTGSDNGSGSDFRIKCSGGEQTQYIKRYGEKMQNGEVQRTKTGVAFVCVLMLLWDFKVNPVIQMFVKMVKKCMCEILSLIW